LGSTPARHRSLIAAQLEDPVARVVGEVESGMAVTDLDPVDDDQRLRARVEPLGAGDRDPFRRAPAGGPR